MQQKTRKQEKRIKIKSNERKRLGDSNRSCKFWGDFNRLSLSLSFFFTSNHWACTLHITSKRPKASTKYYSIGYKTGEKPLMIQLKEQEGKPRPIK